MNSGYCWYRYIILSYAEWISSNSHKVCSTHMQCISYTQFNRNADWNHLLSPVPNTKMKCEITPIITLMQTWTWRYNFISVIVNRSPSSSVPRRIVLPTELYKILFSNYLFIHNIKYVLLTRYQHRKKVRRVLRYGPLTRYVKLQVAHAPGMPGTFSPAADVKGNR